MAEKNPVAETGQDLPVMRAETDSEKLELLKEGHNFLTVNLGRLTKQLEILTIRFEGLAERMEIEEERGDDHLERILALEVACKAKLFTERQWTSREPSPPPGDDPWKVRRVSKVLRERVQALEHWLIILKSDIEKASKEDS